MNSKAFTLIELLAVIVILAIISLIAVPIVVNIINDSKNSSDEQSVELYLDTVEKTITKQQLSNSNFNPDKCEIKDKGNLECFKNNQSLGLIEVEMKGQLPNDGKIIIRTNKFDYINIMLNGKKYYPAGKLVNDADNNKKISVGDEYKYKVNDKDTFNFYVLSLNNDNTVNLIMDRNICNDGTVNYTNENNYCRYQWYSYSWDNSKGPLISIEIVYNATKKWNNVPNLNLVYNDMIDQPSSIYRNDKVYGYKSIIINDGIGVITSRDGTIVTSVGTNEYPIKARLPIISEIINSGCTRTPKTCPKWLVVNLRYDEQSDYNYSINSTNVVGTDIHNIYGYRTLSSNLSTGGDSLVVYNQGYYTDTNVMTSHLYGVRPVITVPITDLAN